MTDDLTRFIDAWGTMGALWGINRSTARVQALLIASEDPLSLDGIAETLAISRGNASMCLKELRGWQVIRRVHRAGDRRDYYVPEEDSLRMFFRILNERKRREFDPALEVVRETLAGAGDLLGERVRDRLGNMETLLSAVDVVATHTLSDEESARTLLKFLIEQVIPRLSAPPPPVGE